MRKANSLLLLILLSATILLVCGCSGDKSTSTTSVQPITLKYATFNTESHGWSQVLIRWQEKVTQETNGRVKFENYFSGTLVGAANAPSEIAAGVTDIGAGYIALQKTGFELSNAARAWYYGNLDTRTVNKIDKEIFEKFPEIRKEYDSVKVLGAWSNPGPYWISTKDKAIRNVGDIKGLQVKSSSWVAQLDALGCAAVAIPMPDTYVALQKGVVDGVMAPLETMYGYSMAEVTKYHTNLGIFQSPQPELLFNRDSWNKLPSDIQKIMEDTIPWCEEELVKAVIAMEDEGIGACEEHGNELITLSSEELAKFYEVMNTVSIREAEALDAKGYPGTEVFKEVRRLIELYSKK